MSVQESSNSATATKQSSTVNVVNPIRSKRLKLIQDDFDTDPIKTIQSFIGNDAEIIDYTLNDIYFDNYIAVDVRYKQLQIDPCKTYYVNTFKRLNMTKQNMFITVVNGSNVCVTAIDPKDKERIDKNKFIAIEIKPIIQSTRSIPYNYYGTIRHTPFHNCNSEMFRFITAQRNSSFQQTQFASNAQTNAQTNAQRNAAIKTVKLFDEDQIASSYNDLIRIFNIRTSFQEQETAVFLRKQTIAECKDPHKLYIININNINDDEEFAGYITASAYREQPFDVLFIPIIDYRITKIKLQNLKNFMQNDYQNYLQWLEVMMK